jgi:predicted AAA+ superfamily ATPase
MGMFYRNISPTLLRLAQTFPILGVTGPRQSGKTTIVKELFGDKPYVSLEDPDERGFATEDPRGFLKRFEDGAIFDEVQRCPNLFSYLQGMVDRDRQPGRFILTGSQQFNLLAGISQSLAGRIGMSRLLPLQWSEIKNISDSEASLDKHLLRGGYPAIYTTHQGTHGQIENSHDWFASYITTYIERDIRQLINIREIGSFQKFIKLCAGRTGQLLNLSALASEAGITTANARIWLSALETSDIIYLLTPYHKNFGKRLVKSPKLYFIDTGLAAWLLGIRNKETLSLHPMRGALFESYVVIEHLKHQYNQGHAADIYFWRDNNGVEADLVYEITENVGGQITQKLQTIEIKSGATVTSDYVKAGKKSGQFVNDYPTKLQLIYGGENSFQRSGIDFVSWRDLLCK